MKYLIVNADDFGAGRGINRGIAEAASKGILTSTSLMVNMTGTAEAVTLRRDLPHISIGLHVNLTNEGSPVVDLENDSACRAEIVAQFQRFQDLTGALPTHLDAHHNIHRRDRLLPYFRDLAAEYALPLREHSSVRYFPDFYGQWDSQTHPEQISVENLIRMLKSEVKSGYTELSCHPGYASEDFSSSYGCEREMELRTLCHQGLMDILHECGIELINYRRWREQQVAFASGNG
jgi:predicted glycoside hydrolase/deacetylase ChbG (UPF0249 family)